MLVPNVRRLDPDLGICTHGMVFRGAEHLHRETGQLWWERWVLCASGIQSSFRCRASCTMPESSVHSTFPRSKIKEAHSLSSVLLQGA